MVSNGFGRHVQTIVIRVDEEHALKASKVLEIDAFKVNDNGQHDFIYKRLTTRLGDDESVMFDVDAKLDLKFGTWSILWNECDY